MFCAIVQLKNGTIVGISMDGVGTKIYIAILMNRSETVGIDLVAMNVNDLIVHGIRPDLFLDYVAMGKQVPQRTASIIKGIVAGCDMARVALVGGEMAEMPGMYTADECDLSGCVIGFADSREDLIFGDAIREGMYVYGIPSSGPHSNGYSLIRRVCDIDMSDPFSAKVALCRFYDQLGDTLGEKLLCPTRIYVDEITALQRLNYTITGMAHITGGGLVENPIRILPDGLAMELDTRKWEMQPIFHFIQEKGNVDTMEMRKTFNCGIGMIVVSPDEIVGDDIIKIGKIIESGKKEVVFI